MATFNETVTVTFVLSPANTEAFHVIGGTDRLVSLWSGSGQALQSPQIADPSWQERTTTEEAQTFFNVGPEAGKPKVQTVKSRTTLS